VKTIGRSKKHARVGSGACILLASTSRAQDKAEEKGEGMMFHGRVEAVTEKGLTVNGEKVGRLNGRDDDDVSG
jgi:hypothetical protein